MKELNLSLRFLLELALLASFAYWGFQTNLGMIRWAVGLGIPILIAIVWGLWIAPHAQTRLNDPWRFGLEIILFLAGTLALWFAQQHSYAIGFAITMSINLLLMFIWNQR